MLYSNKPLRITKRPFILVLVFLLSIGLLAPSYSQSVDSKKKAQQKVQPKEQTVYVTRTGAKYHTSTCRYLRQSKIPMSLNDAKASYDPCKVCKPSK